MNQPVTWGPPRGERADAARNRQLLLATAREILAEQGADKLTMDGLAERAGLGKGTVFRQFGTRAGIFQALLDDDERDFQQRVLSGPPPLGPGALPLDHGPVLTYLSAADLTDAAARVSERLGQGWEDLVRRVARSPRNRRRVLAGGKPEVQLP